MKSKTLDRQHQSKGKLDRFGATIVIASALAYVPAMVSAAPTIFMQSATIQGASDKVTVNRVPVQDAAGNITYKNVVMAFNVDPQGRLSLRPGSFTITPSPILNVGAFKPGTYRGYQTSYGGGTFKVGSPGIGPGGRISGSIQRVTTSPRDAFNANWISGPIAGHPNQAQLNAANIASTAYNWGVMGTAGEYTTSSGWNAGDIIGVIQNGDQLSIVNYGNDNIPDATLSFDLCPTADPC